ncbi:chemotaxis-specific protein-glutamate methyltransferase CheB [Aquabacterium sp. A7-Y]|uniref:chemotaxis-specific protein-glutamate methyltransferase CheB n=1 Tax=Aquabacterium sp. A7-Y TaxID=1349605 RepID=UPI00223D36FD|nr:chemotaxis-specific protein-glutamate methyltransferase CheB [Aquabacterium sp. A7-Y]MCW7541092.1 chemotaxis-specific protein-glutamate methyltransferase CheB [Aquabacterium sp. A7-Y]
MKKVLVVDDSALMRKLIGGVLSEAGYQVHTARHGAEGVEQLLAVQPDVVTLDINMPEMDGLTALSLMMAARPTPVVMVSSLTEKGALATFEALALGAVDFIAKPGGTITLKVDDIKAMLLEKVAAAARARVAPAGRAGTAAGRPALQARPTAKPPAAPLRTAAAPAAARAAAGATAAMGAVLIGVSTGGPRTLEDILPRLPADFPWPVLIAQHMPLNFTDAFARRMDGLCALQVSEVQAPVALEPGRVYIGRAGTDLALSDRGGRPYAVPRPEQAGMPWHPSVDVLVDSAMKVLPPQRLVGVMLTGMGYDGAAAMTRLRQAGGRTIAESAETAVVFGMPQELIERGGASLVLPAGAIANQLRHWVQ